MNYHEINSLLLFCGGMMGSYMIGACLFSGIFRLKSQNIKKRLKILIKYLPEGVGSFLISIVLWWLLILLPRQNNLVWAGLAGVLATIAIGYLLMNLRSLIELIRSGSTVAIGTKIGWRETLSWSWILFLLFLRPWSIFWLCLGCAIGIVSAILLQ